MKELEELRNMIAEDHIMVGFLDSIDALIEIYQRLCDKKKDVYTDNTEALAIYVILSYTLDTEFIRFRPSELDLLDNFIKMYMKHIMNDIDYQIYLGYDNDDTLMKNIIMGVDMMIVPGYVKCSKTRAYQTMHLLIMSREFLRTLDAKNSIKEKL